MLDQVDVFVLLYLLCKPKASKVLEYFGFEIPKKELTFRIHSEFVDVLSLKRSWVSTLAGNKGSHSVYKSCSIYT